jgi:hypothetical protein
MAGHDVLFPVIGMINHGGVMTCNCQFIFSPSFFELILPMIAHFTHEQQYPIAIIMTTKSIREGEELFINYYPYHLIMQDRERHTKLRARQIPIDVMSQDMKKSVQQIKKISKSGCSTITPYKQTLIENFEETHKKLMLASILLNPDLDNPSGEYNDILIYALVVWRIQLTNIFKQILERFGNIPEIQFNHFYDTDERVKNGTDKFIVSNLNISIDRLRDFFSNIKTALTSIMVRGPSDPFHYTPGQKIIRQSIYSILNKVAPPVLFCHLESIYQQQQHTLQQQRQRLQQLGSSFQRSRPGGLVALEPNPSWQRVPSSLHPNKSMIFRS